MEEENKNNVVSDSNWQRQLMPFMKYMLIAFSLFFFSATLIQLYYLHQKIDYSVSLDLDKDLKPLSNSENINELQWLTISKLEGHALNRRYHQANVTLMSGIWIKYLGFLTGMIITLSGAVFILGKIEIKESKLNIDNPIVGKNSLQSSSPGLFLVLLGVVLMIFISKNETKVDVKDGPAYISTYPMLNKKAQIMENSPSKDVTNEFNHAQRKDSTSAMPAD